MCTEFLNKWDESICYIFSRNKTKGLYIIYVYVCVTQHFKYYIRYITSSGAVNCTINYVSYLGYDNIFDIRKLHSN